MAYYTRLAARNGAKQGEEPMYTPKKTTPRKQVTTTKGLEKKLAGEKAKAAGSRIASGVMKPRKYPPGIKRGKKEAGRVVKA